MLLVDEQALQALLVQTMPQVRITVPRARHRSGAGAKFRAPLAGRPIGDFGSLHQGVKPQLLTPIDFCVLTAPALHQGLPIWCCF